MKIILLKTLKGIGPKGSITNAKKGFVMNYLIPNQCALLATPVNIQNLKKEKDNNAKEYNATLTLITRIKKCSIIITREATQSNHLYNAISQEDIIDALASFQIQLPRSSIYIKKKIKTFGTHEIDIHLYYDLNTTININVIKNKTEKKELLNELTDNKITKIT